MSVATSTHGMGLFYVFCEIITLATRTGSISHVGYSPVCLPLGNESPAGRPSKPVPGAGTGTVGRGYFGPSTPGPASVANIGAPRRNPARQPWGIRRPPEGTHFPGGTVISSRPAESWYAHPGRTASTRSDKKTREVGQRVGEHSE